MLDTRSVNIVIKSLKILKLTSSRFMKGFVTNVIHVTTPVPPKEVLKPT